MAKTEGLMLYLNGSFLDLRQEMAAIVLMDINAASMLQVHNGLTSERRT